MIPRPPEKSCDDPSESITVILAHQSKAGKTPNFREIPVSHYREHNPDPAEMKSRRAEIIRPVWLGSDKLKEAVGVSDEEIEEMMKEIRKK